jgi:hypothetical protein
VRQKEARFLASVVGTETLPEMASVMGTLAAQGPASPDAVPGNARLPFYGRADRSIDEVL